MIERFIREYSERAFQFAYHLCGNAEDAHELVQEAFFRVIRHWSRYDASQPLENWFLTILKNVYYDGFKKWGRSFASLDAEISSDGEGATFADSIADGEEDLQRSLERKETVDAVSDIMETLKPEYRAILMLSDMQGLNYQQIAAVLDCPAGTVRSRLCRARAAFKKIMRRGKHRLTAE